MLSLSEGAPCLRSKGLLRGVCGEPAAGVRQEPGDEGQHQEVQRRGQETRGVRRPPTGPEEICTHGISISPYGFIIVTGRHSSDFNG